MTNNISFRVIAACSLGTVLEWYDFSLYAFLAPIISLLFFPNHDPFTATILTYSVFTIGFLARPIGAILFGHFGDQLGRKRVLIISILIIATTTCMIGLLPTYARIGIFAPLLLVLLRICQGIAIGGEVAGAGSFVFESSRVQQRGFATAMVWSSSGLGLLLSSLTVALTTWIFSQEILVAWAWRIPFLLGSLTGVLGYYLRVNTAESVPFQLLQQSNEISKFPFMVAMRNYRPAIMITIGLYILSAITTYLVFVFMPVYAAKNLGLPLNQAMLVNTVAMACSILLVPIMGSLSDKVGRKVIMLSGAVGFLFFSLPLYWLITHAGMMGLMIAQFIFSVLSASFNGPLTSAVLEMFPIQVRYSATAFSYNLSYSLFGGTAPIIAVFFIGILGSNIAPAFYLAIGALIAVFAVLKMSNGRTIYA